MNPAALVMDASLAAQARHARFGGLAGSLLLHLIVVVLLLWSPKPELPEPPETMVVEVIALPQRAPEPPAVVPAPEPEPPPPIPVPLVPPPPPPQLNEAPIAEKSAPPPAPTPRPGPLRERPAARAPQAVPSPPAPPVRRPAIVVPQSTPQSTPLEAGREDPGGGGEPDSVASQSVQDFILAQIARHWLIDVRGPRFRNIVLYGQFVLLPNGLLAPPHGKNDPWNPRAMIKNYDDLRGPGGEAIRSALETFLLAVRQAQPFRLPPDGHAAEPRALPLRFRLGDL